jgi:hypothetical protein
MEEAGAGWGAAGLVEGGFGAIRPLRGGLQADLRQASAEWGVA